MGIDVELFDDWDAIERDAAGALDREAQPLLFDRLSWFRLIADHCPPPGKMVAARAREMSRTGWLFLAIDGSKARAWANWYSLRYGIVGESDVMTAAAAMIRLGGISEIELSPIAAPEPVRAAFREAGWIARVEPATTSWQVATEGMTFVDYWARRPGKLRNTAERKAAGLEIAIATQFDAEAWDAYEAVYAKSWKPGEGSPAFLRALAEQEGQAGTLRLGIARKEGRPVAAQLWLVENGTAWIHKLAYAEDAKSLSPGTMLSMAMFRHVLDEDQVGRIDYGTGDDGYKRDWMEERHQLWRLIAYNPRTLAGLIGATRAAASALVRRMRSR